MTRYAPPPRPQDSDQRTFEVGDRVRAHWTFSNGCPPGPEKIMKGTLGTVSDTPRWERDTVFGDRLRMIPVRWDTGVESVVTDRLLEKELP